MYINQSIIPPAGKRWEFASMRGYCLTPGADYKGKTPPNPVLLYMGAFSYLIHVIRQAGRGVGGGYTLIGAYKFDYAIAINGGNCMDVKGNAFDLDLHML